MVIIRTPHVPTPQKNAPSDKISSEFIISIRCFRPVVVHFPQIARTRRRVFNADRADFLISFI